MPPAKRTKPARSHLMGGCATCRRRHVKCDQVKPQCLTCRAIGVVCEGFSYGLRWVTPGTAKAQEAQNAGSATGEGTRRHLYTEQSMQSMSTVLASNLISKSVDASLSDIDLRTKNVGDADMQEISVGPFRVLNFNNTSDELLAPEVSEPDNQINVLDDAVNVSPNTVESFGNFNDMLDWSDLFALDFSDASNFGALQPLPDDAGVNDGTNTVEPICYPHTDTRNNTEEQALVRQTLQAPGISASIDLTSSICQVLVKHFDTHVIPNMSSLPVDKHSPWRILNMSAAVRTLADVTYLEEQDLKHATLANLLALLAMSALDMARNQLDTNHSPAYWKAYSDTASQEAKQHLQQSLKSEFQGSNKAKYKDQLMAILAMIAYSVLTNNQTDARSYMIDAERLLRIRGLAKRVISRKARLLHHVYTWVRIVGESTYVLHDFSAKKVLLDEVSNRFSADPTTGMSSFSKSRSGQNARLDDFLRLEAADSEDEPDMESPKGRDIGLYDIHLEDPREDPGSMNLRIHGVPETWLTLVSQTTRLANVIDAVNQNKKEKDVRLLETLQKRTERLENLICTFAARDPKLDMSARRRTLTEAEIDTFQLPKDCLNRAFNSALVIFFYRRVRNVNSWILQGHVDDVISALQDFNKAMADANRVGQGSVWPAFMAGCEALTPGRRESIRGWIEKGFALGHSASFRVALDTIQELWLMRDATSPASKQQIRNQPSSRSSKGGECTWMDLLKENRLWPMLH